MEGFEGEKKKFEFEFRTEPVTSVAEIEQGYCEQMAWYE